MKGGGERERLLRNIILSQNYSKIISIQSQILTNHLILQNLLSIVCKVRAFNRSPPSASLYVYAIWQEYLPLSLTSLLEGLMKSR